MRREGDQMGNEMKKKRKKRETRREKREEREDREKNRRTNTPPSPCRCFLVPALDRSRPQPSLSVSVCPPQLQVPPPPTVPLLPATSGTRRHRLPTALDTV